MDTLLLPPANEVCAGYVFTRVCHSVHRGGSRPRLEVKGSGQGWGVCVCRPSPGGCMPACTEADPPSTGMHSSGWPHSSQNEIPCVT